MIGVNELLGYRVMGRELEFQTSAVLCLSVTTSRRARSGPARIGR